MSSLPSNVVFTITLRYPTPSKEEGVFQMYRYNTGTAWVDSQRGGYKYTGGELVEGPLRAKM